MTLHRMPVRWSHFSHSWAQTLLATFLGAMTRARRTVKSSQRWVERAVRVVTVLLTQAHTQEETGVVVGHQPVIGQLLVPHRVVLDSASPRFHTHLHRVDGHGEFHGKRRPGQGQRGEQGRQGLGVDPLQGVADLGERKKAGDGGLGRRLYPR